MCFFIALVVYVITGTLWMLTGFGGARSPTTSELLSDAPAALASAIVAAAHGTPFSPCALRTGWIWFGGRAGSVFRRRCHRPRFPGCEATIRSRVPLTFSSAHFYPALAAAALFLIRRAAVRVPWIQLSLDATIFVVGFRRVLLVPGDPPAAAHAEVDLLKASPESGVPRARLRSVARVGRNWSSPVPATSAAGAFLCCC